MTLTQLRLTRARTHSSVLNERERWREGEGEERREGKKIKDGKPRIAVARKRIENFRKNEKALRRFYIVAKADVDKC